MTRPSAGAMTAIRPKVACSRSADAVPASMTMSAGFSRNTRNPPAKRSTDARPKSASASSPPPSNMSEASSALLTTSPLRWASSSRRCVGSSVRCASSRSSANRSDSEEAHLLGEEIEEFGHHHADHQHQEDETGEDVERHGEEEHLQLRHQAREHAERRIDDQAEDEEGCGELQAERESAGRKGQGELRHVAGRQRLGRRQQAVAAGNRAERQMMQARFEHEKRAYQREEGRDHRALRALAGIEGLGESETGLRGDQE